MKCRRIHEWISLEMDDQLPPEHVGPLAEHLQSCADCREYRADLQLGVRMLAATEPSLPDHFDWKLQLRLSQAMREAARDTHPWQEAPSRWRSWFGRAGLSAAVGLAAVLTMAMLVPGDWFQSPGNSVAMLGSGDLTLRLPTQGVTQAGVNDASRRPLQMDFGGTYGTLQRSVSSRNSVGRGILSPQEDASFRRIRQLELENVALRRNVFGKDREINRLRAQLDSLTAPSVDRN